MSLNAGNLTVISSHWTQFLQSVNSKLINIQYVDDGIIYTVFSYDGPILYSCIIWEGTVPDVVVASGYSQAQNDADKADFLNNYLVYTNVSLSSTKYISMVNSTTALLLSDGYFAGMAEDVSNFSSINLSVYADQPS